MKPTYTINLELNLLPYHGITLTLKGTKQVDSFPLGVSHVVCDGYRFTVNKTIYKIDDGCVLIECSGIYEVDGYTESDIIKKRLKLLGWR